MLILPAIDLQGGGCVRLLRGAFDQSTRYGDPFDVLKRFAAAGAEWIHVVDLDGAQARQPVQHALLAQLAGATSAKLQCGGGVRSGDHVEALLAVGASRVVVGSVAAREPEKVRDWLKTFGAERICVALDVRATADGWEVAADGWAIGTGRSLEHVLDAYPAETLSHVLVTDISRDGALAGPNTALIRALTQARPDISFQASGGVARLEDVRALRNADAAAVIVGRALYEAAFTLEDALAL